MDPANFKRTSGALNIPVLRLEGSQWQFSAVLDVLACVPPPVWQMLLQPNSKVSVEASSEADTVAPVAILVASISPVYRADILGSIAQRPLCVRNRVTFPLHTSRRPSPYLRFMYDPVSDRECEVPAYVTYKAHSNGVTLSQIGLK